MEGGQSPRLLGASGPGKVWLRLPWREGPHFRPPRCKLERLLSPAFNNISEHTSVVSPGRAIFKLSSGKSDYPCEFLKLRARRPEQIRCPTSILCLHRRHREECAHTSINAYPPEPIPVGAVPQRSPHGPRPLDSTAGWMLIPVGCDGAKVAKS